MARRKKNPFGKLSAGTYDWDVSAFCADGYEVKDNGDGTWSATGTANSASFATSELFMIPKGTYTFSGHITTQYESDCFIYIATEDLSIRYDLNDGNSKTFTLDKDTEISFAFPLTKEEPPPPPIAEELLAAPPK